MNRTSIEWTDFTANPLKFRDANGKVVWGCVHESPGCNHCYAETLAHRYGKGGPFNVPTMAKLTPFLDEKELRAMLTYKPAAGLRCFVGDMTDIFGPWVPDALLDRLFAVFALRTDVTWQVLTKRAERMRAYVISRGEATSRHVRIQAIFQNADSPHSTPEFAWPLPNVWLGVSCENQKYAEERIPLLRDTPAETRFISAEPLLGPIDLLEACYRDLPLDARANLHANDLRILDWVIVGGESGPKSRASQVSWIRSLRRQAKSARIACFVKQLGSRVIDRNDAGFLGETPTSWPDTIDQEDRIEHDLDGTRDGYQGAPVRIHLKNRKGGDMNEWPLDLRVREFPESVVPA